MTTKTYTFTGCMVDGSKQVVVVDGCSSMKAAVVKFKSDVQSPGAMSWWVKVTGSKNSHPVTRERWGHAFDGA